MPPFFPTLKNLETVNTFHFCEVEVKVQNKEQEVNKESLCKQHVYFSVSGVFISVYKSETALCMFCFYDLERIKCAFESFVQLP